MLTNRATVGQAGICVVFSQHTSSQVPADGRLVAYKFPDEMFTKIILNDTECPRYWLEFCSSKKKRLKLRKKSRYLTPRPRSALQKYSPAIPVSPSLTTEVGLTHSSSQVGGKLNQFISIDSLLDNGSMGVCFPFFCKSNWQCRFRNAICPHAFGYVIAMRSRWWLHFAPRVPDESRFECEVSAWAPWDVTSASRRKTGSEW